MGELVKNNSLKHLHVYLINAHCLTSHIGSLDVNNINLKLIDRSNHFCNYCIEKKINTVEWEMKSTLFLNALNVTFQS